MPSFRQSVHRPTYVFKHAHRNFLLLVLLCISSLACGQTQDSNPLKFDVIPPSPEAASMGKFVDNPVSTYTGVPKIDIPVYTLKSHVLSLPISLSYHASGIKWEEIPSWVGAGWTLNAGGVVSRTIRGRNDEDPIYGYFMSHAAANHNIPSFFHSNGIFSNANWNFLAPNCASGDPVTPQYRDVLLASKGGLDLEPDQFFFSLPDGQSGKFLFSRTQQMRVIPHQYVNIEHYPHATTGLLFDKWMIIGKDGVKYFFEKKETTTNNSPCKELFNGDPETFTIPDVNAVSSWRLVKMEDASGTDSITFDYVAEGLTYETRMSTTTYDPVFSTMNAPSTSTCKNETTVNSWRLSQINTAAGYKIVFVANSSNMQAAGNYPLEQIKIYYKTNFLKRFVLTRGGLISTLESLQEFFHETNSTPKLPSYEFTYYTDYSGAGPAYSQVSNSLDHWGYYNGADNTYKYSPPVAYAGKYYNGGNRSANLQACRFMTLKQIRYPTGGTVNYDYELNTFTNLPYSTEFDHLSELELIESVEFTVTNANPALPIAYQTKPFTLSQATPVVILWEVPGVSGNGQSGGGQPATGLNATLSGPVSRNFGFGSSVVEVADIENFPAGNYTLSGQFQDGAYPLNGSKFYVKIYRFKSAQELATAGQLKGGGLRIKKIESTGDNTYTKTYTYTAASTGVSSGKMLSFPHYTYIAQFDNGQTGTGICQITNSGSMLVRVNAPTMPLSVAQGGHVGYSEVKEYTGTTTVNNGYTIFTFTNTPDGGGSHFPFVPAASYAYKNGLALTQKVFTTGSKIVQESSNEYSYSNDAGFIIQGAKVAQVTNSGCNGCSNRAFAAATYSEPTERVLLQSTTSKAYDLYSDNFVESSSSFIYNSNDQVIQKSQSLSNEPQRKKYTNYQYHSTFLSSPVVEYSYYSTNHTNDFEFTGGVERTLSMFNKPTDVGLLETLPQTRTTNNPFTYNLFKHRAHLDYDAKGNIVSITKIGDPMVTAVVWDSNGIFPIAQVLNATPAKIAFTSFENGANEGGWTFNTTNVLISKTGQRAHSVSNAITKSGLNAGQTYLLSYWAKDGVPLINQGVTASNDDASADANGWRYYEKTISGVITFTISGASTIFIDELRLYPVDAQMTTYSHDIVKGLISSTDQNNITTYYEYNNRRQLEFVKDFEKYILKKNEYRYARD